MSQTIKLSDEVAALLQRQADARDITVEAWIEALAREKLRVLDFDKSKEKVIAAATKLLASQRPQTSYGNWIPNGVTRPSRVRRRETPQT